MRKRVILSERLWTRRFGADRTIVGETITLDGRGARSSAFCRGPVWLANNDVFVPSSAGPTRIAEAGSSQ